MPKNYFNLCVLAISLFTHSETTFAQGSNDEQLQQKYWVYKQRFLKNFIAYSPSSVPVKGSGLPINNINTFTKGGADYDPAKAADYYDGIRKGMIKQGDEPEQVGMYLSILSLEYRMLKNEGKSTKATLNEIYYLIQALNRMDDRCESFLANQSSGLNRNGFLMRSDGDQELVQFFNNEYISTDDARDNIRGIENDYHNVSGDADVDSSKREFNTMSKDHVMDIFKGFQFVKKFVDNELVQPTVGDVPIYVHNEIIAITDRIMNHINKLHPIAHEDFTDIVITEKGLCSDGDIDLKMNYVIWNPVHNKLVPRGNNFNIWAYPIALMAKKITGFPYNNTPLKITLDVSSCSTWQYQFLNKSLSIAAPIDDVPHAWIAVGSHINATFNSAQSLINELGNVDISVNIPKLAGIPVAPINSIHIKPDVDKMTATFGDVVQLCLSLATMSDTWPQSKIVAAGDDRFLYNYDLMYALINNASAIHDKSFFENILLTAPCQGNYNYNYPDNDPVTGAPTWDPIWWHNNRWVHPTDANFTYGEPSSEVNEQGELNGLDYMFLYTMYRYYFSGSIPGKFANDNSCPCSLQPKIEANTFAPAHQILDNNVTFSRKFSGYKNIGIYLKEYINTDLYIQNSKTLINTTNLIVCNNSLVKISGNGSFINPNTSLAGDSVKVIVNTGSSVLVDNLGTLDIGNNTKMIIHKDAHLTATNSNSKIIIRPGGKLIIEPGAFLELNNGAKLIVEDGGQVIIQTKIASGGATSENGVLTYNQGAEIQLKGDNAVLELNGRLHIGNNATFGITYPGSNSGYIKFNRGAGVWWNNWAPNNAHITCGTNAKINLQGKSKTDKLIDINQDNVAIPKNLAQLMITKCQVDFNTLYARLETDRPSIITNATFATASSNIGGGRGLLVFGQPTCIISNCDFKDLGTSIMGALFYTGKKLTGVKNCNFYNIGGILTYGGGVSISNNYFEKTGIGALDATANSLLYKNTMISFPSIYGTGAATSLRGSNIEFEVRENTINGYDYGLACANTNLKARCNDLQNNKIGLLAGENSKINMSSDLGGGYNNANNCEKFAWFIETHTFEANNGFNNFKITNSVPCTWIPQSGHGPNITPGYWTCPTITEGSLINFTAQNPIDGMHWLFAENNFWRPLISSTDAVEDRQNKIRKIDLTDPYYPVIDSASLITLNVLTSPGPIICPAVGAGCVGPACRTNNAIHPLDDNSNSSIITTASFYNKKLQKALQFSLSKMDAMQNPTKVNEVTDLFTEILKFNYAAPVRNSVDKYLLELAYQKLFICVAQLAEMHRDSAATFNPMPASLQTRFNDLHTICALRAGRKDITEKDYKEISDLILLDKAMLYRITDNHQSALSVVNSVIANNPKTSHLKMYENFQCLWSTELDAIMGNISVDKALEQLKVCSDTYLSLPKQTLADARKAISKQESDVVYASNYAIAVFPNPTNGTLSVAYSLTEFKSIKLEIFDTQGKMMGVYNLNPEEQTVNIDDLNLENGVYFYSIKGNGKTLLSKKLVVVK